MQVGYSGQIYESQVEKVLFVDSEVDRLSGNTAAHRGHLPLLRINLSCDVT